MFRNPVTAATPANFRFVSRCQLAVLSLAAALSLTGAAILWQPPAVAAQNKTPPANTPEFYTQRVLPIFEANCYHCHGGPYHRGDLSMATRAGMLKGGKDGAAIVPGNADQSLLIQLIRHEGPVDDPMPMPPKSKISDADIATVAKWVEAGAVMPAE